MFEAGGGRGGDRSERSGSWRYFDVSLSTFIAGGSGVHLKVVQLCNIQRRSDASCACDKGQSVQYQIDLSGRSMGTASVGRELGRRKMKKIKNMWEREI